MTVCSLEMRYQSNWLLKPYIYRQSLSVQEENFNKNLASAKVTVECAFGKLKVIWRCLLTMQKQSPRGVLQKRCSKRFCKIHRKTLVVETLAQVFAYEFFEIFKSTFSYREPPVAASENVSNTIITCFVCTTSVRLMEKLTWKTTVYMKSWFKKGRNIKGGIITTYTAGKNKNDFVKLHKWNV